MTTKFLVNCLSAPPPYTTEKGKLQIWTPTLTPFRHHFELQYALHRQTLQFFVFFFLLQQ